MTTTYPAHMVAPYDHHVLPSYHSAMATSRPQMPAISETARPPLYQKNSQQHVFPPFPGTLPRDPTPGATQLSTSSRHSTRTCTPVTESSATAQRGTSHTKSCPQTLVHHSLQIPSCISSQGGNLADFAAQVTCFFWFETMETLRAAESIRSRPANLSVLRLTKHAVPYTAFKKWAYGVLSTTQVTQSVVLLALLFVYRLKMTNPGVKGRSGSEYRLLTVALMLGNKFLDDNTYTNKTWAEVSGISVQEIHVMEVEFLSNMRYSLLASKGEWEDWLERLACFSEYYDRALAQPVSPVAASSPGSHPFSSPLPSPTASVQGPPPMAGLAPSTAMCSPNSNAHLDGQAWPQSLPNMLPASPLDAKSYPQAPLKKRAPDDENVAEHPAKRPARQFNSAPPVQNRPPVVGDQPIRLPVPSLTLNTNTPAPNQVPPYLVPTNYSNQTPNHVSLPPLVPGVRAMSSVYPTNSGPVTTAQLPLPSTTGPGQGSHTALTPTTVLPPHAALGYGTPSRRQSPGTLAAIESSPADHYPAASSMHTPVSHTPMLHSPSVYLQQRPSPYKPIRHVNTLLYPPPSASLNEYHVPATAPQMHYLPLGRRNDLRSGVVPEYMTMAYRSIPPVQLPPHNPNQGYTPN